MKKSSFYGALLLAVCPVLFTSCEVIGGIFKAGVWVGVVGVILVIALVIRLIMGRKK